MFFLVISKIFLLFVNKLIADVKYSLFHREFLQQQIQTQLRQKQSFFLKFLMDLWNLLQILNILEKKDEPHSLCTSQIRDCKRNGWLREMSKKPHFRTSVDSQHVKGSQTLLKHVRSHFYHISSYLCDKMSSEMSLLKISEILGLFVNMLTADDNLSFQNRENLPQQYPMPLSNFVLHFWDLDQISNILEKKMSLLSWCIS